MKSLQFVVNNSGSELNCSFTSFKFQRLGFSATKGRNSCLKHYYDQLQLFNQGVLCFKLYYKLSYARIWLVLTYNLLEDRPIDDVIVKTFFLPYILILYYIKQIDFRLPCVCSVIDHRWTNVGTKKWHTRRSQVCHWCSYHILTSSEIHYWIDTRQLGIYLLDRVCMNSNDPYSLDGTHPNRVCMNSNDPHSLDGTQQSKEIYWQHKRFCLE